MYTNISEYIDICRIKRGNMKKSELAERTGQTLSNMTSKHSRNVFKTSELEKIAEAFGADLRIEFVDKEGNPIA